MAHKKIIAAFDFDGTLTNRDSFMDFLLYSFGIFFAGKKLLKNSPNIIGYLLGYISNHTAKEKVFNSFFQGYPYKQFIKLCDNYSLNRINAILRPNAITKLNWHLSQGHMLVLVSASIKHWISPWAEKAGFIEIIATEPEVKNGYLTGRFATPNCYGEEKKRRFLERFNYRESYELYVYGDSKGDIQLLSISDRAFYRSF